MKIIKSKKSVDTKNIKFLQKTDDNIITETAFIDEEDKFHICFASQLGCPIGCKFCYNGVYKNYFRNLTKDEIIDECCNVVNELNLDKRNKIILFSCMGIGEPLLNYDNVKDAMITLNKIYPNSKFALATTGINPELISAMGKDLNELNDFKLTISLHATNDKLRRTIIPLNSTIDIIKKHSEEFKKNSKHKIEWNYLLLDNVNDSVEDAKNLIKLIDSDNIKITVFNEINGSNLKKSTNIEKFLEIFNKNNRKYKLFESSGTDIEIGCGQMITHYNEN